MAYADETGSDFASIHAAVRAEGQAANERGELRESCPYPGRDEWARVWLAGFDAAQGVREQWEALCDEAAQ